MKKIAFVAIAMAIGLLNTACSSRSTVSTPAQPTPVANAAPVNTAPVNAAPVGEGAIAAPVQAVPVQAVPVQAVPAPVAFVAPVQAAAAPVAASPAAPMMTHENSYFVKTNDGSPLNVRASNSAQSRVIGSIPQGTQVLMHLSDRDGSWFEVSAAGNIRGWVSAAYLVDPQGQRAWTGPAPQTVAAQPAPSPVQEPGDDPFAQAAFNRAHAPGASGPQYRVQTMDGDPLNMRVSPQLGTQVVRALPNGTTVTYLDTVGQWTQVMSPDGSVGYVASDYLVQR